MTTILHDPRAGLTETQRKAAEALTARRRRLNGTELQERAKRTGHSVVCVGKMVLAMKVEASPPSPPAETWEERQSRLNPLPVEKPGWFLIDDEIASEPRKPRIEDIQRAVATCYNVSRADMVCARRTADIVRPRQIAMYLAKTLTPKSYPEIGRRFGGRDHTTILHAFRKIAALVDTDASIADEVSRLSTLIQEMN